MALPEKQKSRPHPHMRDKSNYSPAATELRQIHTIREVLNQTVIQSTRLLTVMHECAAAHSYLSTRMRCCFNLGFLLIFGKAKGERRIHGSFQRVCVVLHERPLAWNIHVVRSSLLMRHVGRGSAQTRSGNPTLNLKSSSSFSFKKKKKQEHDTCAKVVYKGKPNLYIGRCMV